MNIGLNIQGELVFFRREYIEFDGGANFDTDYDTAKIWFFRIVSESSPLGRVRGIHDVGEDRIRTALLHHICSLFMVSHVERERELLDQQDEGNVIAAEAVVTVKIVQDVGKTVVDEQTSKSIF